MDFLAWLKFVFVFHKEPLSHLARHVSCAVVGCSLCLIFLHIPLALQIRLLYCSFLMEMPTATIHDTERRLAKWLNRQILTELVKTTPQMTRFRDAKMCNKWLQVRIDDHRIQSDYKYKSELQNSEGKKSVLSIACAW